MIVSMLECIFVVSCFCSFSCIYGNVSSIANWTVPTENYLDKVPVGFCRKGTCLQSQCLAGPEFDELKANLKAGRHY